jgi:hypothetical protein
MLTWKTKVTTMTKQIELSQGLAALVSDDDFEIVSQFKWHATNYRGHWYAARKVRRPNGKWTPQYMHRAILLGFEVSDSRRVCHRDRRATLDNTRENLYISGEQPTLTGKDGHVAA